MEVTLAQAADRLGVSKRQVQRLAANGQLNAVRRVGRSILVEDSGITALQRRRGGPGRRWDERTAWAAIDLLDHGSTRRLSGSTLSRLKTRLGHLTVEDVVRLASRRATTSRHKQTRRLPEALKSRLLLSGPSSLEDDEMARQFGLASGRSELVEGYVDDKVWSEVRDDFGLVTDAEGEVLIHITNETALSSPITTALDMIDRGSTRERAAGEQLIAGALQRA